MSAESILREQGRHGAKRRAVVDQAAAVLILQTALDTERVERAGTGRDRRGDTMSEHEDQLEDEPVDDYDYVPGGRRRKGRGVKGCLAVLVALAVLVGGFSFGLTQGVDWVSDQFQGPEDYPGPGTGSVEFTVNEGDTVAQIGRNLKAEGVTKSVQAFIDAAAGEPDSSGIQVGDYELQKEMKAADALEVLIDPANLIGFPTVTIPEGLRLVEIVSTLAENTDFPEARVEHAPSSSPTSSACPTTPRATPRATSSRRPTRSSRA